MMNSSSRFSHLAQSVNVKKHSGLKLMSVGLMCFLSLGVVIFMILGASSKSEKSGSTKVALSGQESQIFSQNEERIKALEGMEKKLLIHEKSIDAPVLLARQNAPTEMYDSKNESAISSPVETFNKVTSQAVSQFQSLEVDSAPRVDATSLMHPDKTVVQGEFLHAVLETAINSELPGMVRAIVSEPVYAYEGDQVLIPAGSRLVGQYTSALQNGIASARIFVMWNRIITPQGVSILINSPGADALGRGGVGADAIDTHFFEQFGTAILLSIIGAGAQTLGVSSNDQANSADMFRAQVGLSLQNSAGQSLKSQSTNVAPTLHVYQGTPIVVFVAKDLDLSGVE